MQSNRRRGFTLIELLVVIAIIAILAAILFPVFAQARAKARAISCLSNLKQLGLSIRMYQQDYDEMVLPGHSYRDNYNTLLWYPDILDTYVKSAQVFVCPDRSNFTTGGRASFPLGRGPNRRELQWSYAYNASWDCCGLDAQTNPIGQFRGDSLGRYFPYPVEAVFERPAEYISLFDGCTLQMWAAAFPSPNLGSGTTLGYDIMTNADRTSAAWGQCRASMRKSHNEGFNLLFMDGHAKQQKATRLENWAVRPGGDWSWAE